MAQEKEQTKYEEMLLETAVYLDVELETVRRVVQVFFGNAREEIIQGWSFRVPNFGTFTNKGMAGRRWRVGLGRQGMSKPTVGAKFVPSRRMVERMRQVWAAGGWK